MENADSGIAQPERGMIDHDNRRVEVDQWHVRDDGRLAMRRVGVLAPADRERVVGEPKAAQVVRSNASDSARALRSRRRSFSARLRVQRRIALTRVSLRPGTSWVGTGRTSRREILLISV